MCIAVVVGIAGFVVVVVVVSIIVVVVVVVVVVLARQDLSSLYATRENVSVTVSPPPPSP